MRTKIGLAAATAAFVLAAAAASIAAEIDDGIKDGTHGEVVKAIFNTEEDK